MRLSPISQSRSMACSGYTKAEKRWPLIVPLIQVPLPAARRVFLVKQRSLPRSCSVVIVGFSKYVFGTTTRLPLVRRNNNRLREHLFRIRIFRVALAQLQVYFDRP